MYYSNITAAVRMQNGRRLIFCGISKKLMAAFFILMWKVLYFLYKIAKKPLTFVSEIDIIIMQLYIISSIRFKNFV